MTVTLGFSKATFAFLRGLAENNEKAWFEAHRGEYESEVREPFVEALEAAAEATAGGPWELHGGRETMFRINRDVRFAKDKSPYKTAVGGLLTPSGDKRENAGVAYLHLADGGGFVACGYHQLSPSRLAPIRDQIIERADEFTRVLAGLTERGRALSDDDTLRAMPRGYSQYADHEHSEHLRRRSFMVLQNMAQKDWISGDVVDKTRALVADSAALVAFVARADRTGAA
ncbi:MAG: DUF2461 domain-containing protein [Actinomycetia bacterium]|nr:DUF2461 domain-containing protein [Actinomycetes bacterium]MCH9701258.1 DUF2461 domain-containing protein [Actinomycetes bacterium]MCH9760918.1 DUF2461 domain-containing protein [Actinomycetes bacterium]